MASARRIHGRFCLFWKWLTLCFWQERKHEESYKKHKAHCDTGISERLRGFAEEVIEPDFHEWADGGHKSPDVVAKADTG